MPRGGTEEVRHLRGRVVATADQHICRQCNKWFASATSLESHKRIHASKQPETPQKRRAVAPASTSGAKRARIQPDQQEEQEGGVSTRSGVGYTRSMKCKVCGESFTEKSEWAAHVREKHPPEKPRVTRQTVAGGAATLIAPASTPPTPIEPRRRRAVRASDIAKAVAGYSPPPPEFPPAAAVSPSSAISPARSRNTTLRFEEELDDGNVQCRQCQQVFNNRRGLAAHVAQKHREELDVEQRTIEEEKLQKGDDAAFRRRRDASSRLIHTGIPQLITTPSRPISILTRRTPGSVTQQQQRSSVSSAIRPVALVATSAPLQSVIYPRRSTLEILTQPTPLVQSSVSGSTRQPTSFLSSENLRVSESSKRSTAPASEDQPMGAYTEPFERQRQQQQAASAAAAQSKSPAGATDQTRSADGDEDEILDEAAYEFSTEVTVAPVASQGQETGLKSPRSTQSPSRARSGRSAGANQAAENEELEVENYPCKFCKDRVFLTSYGLERHTKMSHPNQLDEVINDLRKAQLEKAKRDGAGGDERLYIDEGSRSYDRFPHLDARHQIPGLGMAAQSASYTRRKFGEKQNGTEEDSGDVLQIARDQSAALVAGASFTGNSMAPRARRPNDAARAKYQSCDICGILINTEHPKALESHTKAHQKNQELRQELLRMYGPGWVDRVTCRECNLVFKDEDKLDQHRRNVHVRRRHFLCRFCGDVFRNMRDLNLHKERRHEAFEGHRRLGDASPPLPRRQGPPTGRRGFEGMGDMGGGPEEFACRSTCEVCGLQMVRPSNLIRHMKLTHNRTNFTATVETRGMPPFKIDVNEGQFMWGCCDEVFDDRQAFISHRRAVHHGPSYTSSPKECEHCGLTFKNNATYFNHLRTHRTRVCSICAESFGNTVVDLNAFRAHMIRHREQGYTVRLPPIEEELATREQQELWRAINEEEEDGGSEDEYSIYSESGVESDVEEDSSSDDDAPPDQMTCPMCEKTFSCVYRYSDHWKLHCRQPFRDGLNFKTEPFSCKNRGLAPKFKCGLCSRKFKMGQTLAVHSVTCGQRRRGILPSDEAETSTISGGSAKMPSPTKGSPQKKSGRELAAEVSKQTVGGGDGKDKDKEISAAEGSNQEESMKELEDQLEVRPKKKEFVPDFVEKAYVVEWDTTKPPSEKPYLCQNCRQSFGDFLSLIMHVKTHIAHPISEFEEDGDEGAATAEEPAGGEDASEKQEKKKKEKEEKTTVSILRIRTSTADALGKYSCQVCGRCFQDSESLKEHLDDAHRPHKQHRCRLCRRRFWTSAGLQRHERRRHNASGLHHYCGVCGKKFTNAESVAAHESKHELSNSLYQCEDCAVSFFGLQQLKQHFKEHHHGVTILSCPVCSRIHTDRKALNEHFDNDHPTVRTLCKVCDKVFHTPAEARRHRRRIHMEAGKTSEPCTLCGKKYFDKRQLAVHTWRHLSTKSHQCRICDEPFENDEEVRTHLENKHDIGWLDSRDLIVHNSTVFGKVGDEELGGEERCFSCHICGKKFDSKAAVKEHLGEGVHKRVKKRECPSCEMKFWKPWALADHMNRRHRQEVISGQVTEATQDKDHATTEQGQAVSANVAQLLLNQGQLGNLQYVTGDNVQMIVADEATAAAVMAAAGGGQEYQVLLVQNENGETVQLALGPQAQVELAQLQQQPAEADAGTQRTATHLQQQPGVEGQPMEIDETNYQQFLNQ